MRPSIRVVAVAAALAPIAGPALAAGDDIADGRRIVETRCAGCHRIAATDPARHPEAPALADIAGRYPPRALEEAFAEGVMVGHPDMPIFEFPPDDIRKLIRFLESLRP